MIGIETTSNGIKLTGHARYDVLGKDLVCAAVSTLWYTLITKLRKEEVSFQMIEEEGYCEMWLMQAGNNMTDTVMDTILCGLELLAQNYPENLSIKKL